MQPRATFAWWLLVATLVALTTFRLARAVDRFSPSFGSFNVRHDPANHELSGGAVSRRSRSA